MQKFAQAIAPTMAQATAQVATEATQTEADAKKAQTFRMSWLRLYAVMAFWVSATMTLLLLLLHSGTPDRVILSVLFSQLLFICAFAGLLAGCSPVALSADGVRGFNFYGFRCAMTWDEIGSATPSRYFGLPWLIIRSRRTKNALWLPLFFADKRGFWKTASRLAPPDCPLFSPATDEPCSRSA